MGSRMSSSPGAWAKFTLELQSIEAMERDPLSNRVIGLAIEVHRTLGPGLFESVYETCLCDELTNAEIPFEQQVEIPVCYKGRRMEVGFRADLVVEKELVIEIKSVDKLGPLHEAQVLTYLRLGGFRKALLMNFNTRLLRDGIRRFAM